MVDRLSRHLATLCASRNIIDQQYVPHLQYKAEIVLRSSLFSLFLILIAFLLQKPLEVFTYSLTIYLVRRRMGGWHAPKPWICQLLSVGIVLLMTLLVGSLFTKIPRNIFFFPCLALDILSFFLSPAYPSQLHLTVQEEKANNKRKNAVLAFVALIQILAFLSWDYRIVIYTFLGLATTVITVLLEKICLKEGRRAHEHTEENFKETCDSVH